MVECEPPAERLVFVMPLELSDAAAALLRVPQNARTTSRELRRRGGEGAAPILAPPAALLMPSLIDLHVRRKIIIAPSPTRRHPSTADVKKNITNPSGAIHRSCSSVVLRSLHVAPVCNAWTGGVGRREGA